MDQKSNSNLSPVAKTVLEALTPFYKEILRIPDPETGKALTEVLNKMAKYGSELSRDINKEEREFYEGQVKPLITFITGRLSELRENVRTKAETNPEFKTESNVKTNFITGLKKEAYQIDQLIDEDE